MKTFMGVNAGRIVEQTGQVLESDNAFRNPGLDVCMYGCTVCTFRV